MAGPLKQHKALWVANTAWLAALATIALLLAPTFALMDILKLAAAAYVGQEAAHLITGEKTFQSTYIVKKSWPSLLLGTGLHSSNFQLNLSLL
jgi:hypothetical protein